MDFNQLTADALRIKNKYRQLEIARIGREWNLSELTEGLIGDIGDLMKLVMAKEGKRVIENVDEKLEEELVDCLWAIICIADKLNINLGAQFEKKMKKLELRIDESLKKPQNPD